MTKKFIITLILSVITTITFATNSIKVKSGTTEFLLETITTIVDFDYTNTNWNNTQINKNQAQESFIVAFNKYSKGIALARVSDKSKYKLVFHISNIEQTNISGTIDIIEISTKKTICQFEVWAETFESLGENLAKLK